jgi:hypothetical protein
MMMPPMPSVMDGDAATRWAACRADGALPDWRRRSSSRRIDGEEHNKEVRMSGVIDSSDTRGNTAEHHNSAAFSDRAVRGILWGAEPATSKFSTNSATYKMNWWSRGESNP